MYKRPAVKTNADPLYGTILQETQQPFDDRLIISGPFYLGGVAINFN